MFHTQDPRKTILFYIEDFQQLALVKVTPEGRLIMEETADQIDFVNKVLQGDKGICLKKDLTVTYITVTKRTWKLKDQPINEQHVIKISKGLYSQSYCF